MKVIGNITKSGNYYNVNIKCDGFNVFKKTRIYDLESAQEYLKFNKPEIIKCTEVMRSFPELEGTRVEYFTGSRYVKGIIIGCDYHIGITVVDVNDKNKYLCCVRGPLSPQGKEINKKHPEKYNTYHKFFKNAVELIKDGYYDSDEIKSRAGDNIKSGGGASKASCAFGV